MAFHAPVPPPFTCGQCHQKVFLWCVYCEGCLWCLEGEECVARRFKDRDESRWVLQKWEEKVEVGKMLHPTQSHAKTAPSSPFALPNCNMLSHCSVTIGNDHLT